MKREERRMDRRSALRLLAGAAAGAATSSVAGRLPAMAQAKPAFTLPPLPYAYEALEPHIDTTTMMIHHVNHHAAYVATLNAQVEKFPELATKPIETFLAN